MLSGKGTLQVQFKLVMRWVMCLFSRRVLSTDCRTPGLPVLHCLLESAQAHVHWIGDAIQPSHPWHPLLLPLQSFLASGSFQLFASDGQSIGASVQWTELYKRQNMRRIAGIQNADCLGTCSLWESPVRKVWRSLPPGRGVLCSRLKEEERVAGWSGSCPWELRGSALQRKETPSPQASTLTAACVTLTGRFRLLKLR